MKYLQIFLLLFCTHQGVFAQLFTEKSYIKSDEAFNNPERGFYKHLETHSANYSAVSASQASIYYQQGYTLVLRIFYLENFRNQDISTDYLNNIKKDFSAIRNSGLKAIVRFAYTTKSSKPYNDAPPSVVNRHIEQLKPIFNEFEDVIVAIQAGFIGAWGEWYYTDYYAVTPGNVSAQNWLDRTDLINKLLSALPESRTVQIRTPYYKTKIIGSETSLKEEEAFSNTAKARISHHNDCFLASYSDVGTYTDTTKQKPYLADETRFLIMGGETCGEFGSHSACINAQKEMRRFHWTYLNKAYHPGVLNSWKDQGCFETVGKQLGYRYYLTKAYLQNEAKPGDKLNVELSLLNEGYANVVNKRNVYLVLKNKSTNELYYVQNASDARFWTMNDTIKLSIEAGLPQNMPVGDYDVFLNLPDISLNLIQNPKYSIRLANVGTWEETLGYNNLGHTLVVNTTASSESYTGSVFLQPITTLSDSRADIKTSVKVYPNPASDKIFVKLNNIEAHSVNYYICNVLGAKVLQGSLTDVNLFESQTINIQHLNSGTYIMVLEDAESGVRYVTNVIK